MQDLGQGCETVSRAARVRDDGVFRRIINRIVDSHADRRVGILRRGADEDSLRATLADVKPCLITAGEKAGRLEHDIDAEIFPRQLARIAFLQDLYLVSPNDDVFFIVADLTV